MDHNDKQVTLFTMLAHPMFHAYELVIPIFVVIWLDVFTTSAAVLGVIVGISYALIGIGALPSGILADRYSAKRLIIICMIGMGGSFVLVAIAPNIYVLSIALILWGRSEYLSSGRVIVDQPERQRTRDSFRIPWSCRKRGSCHRSLTRCDLTGVF